MKLNNDYVRQALINVDCNTDVNYTVESLANIIAYKSNITEHSFAFYAILTIIGELICANKNRQYSAIDKNIEILGLTESGKNMCQYIKDDVIWHSVQKRSEGIGGVSFQVMVDCCRKIGNDFSCNKS